MKKFRNNATVIEAYLQGSYEQGSSQNGNLFFEQQVLYSYGYHFPLAVDIGSMHILNGDRYSNTTSSKHQSPLFRAVPNNRRVEIPFSALAEMMETRRGSRFYTMKQVAQEVISSVEVVDWEYDHYVETGRVNKNGEVIQTHVLGGVLFTYMDGYYMTGMDTSGVEPNGMFFLTQLDQEQMEKYGTPTTMDEAYELLKPDEVRAAEAQGIAVQRQGEWFFIKDEIVKQLIEDEKTIVQKGYVLAHREEKESAHFVTEGFSVNLMGEPCQIVRGIVKHERKEHRMLKLYEPETKAKDREWYFAYESVQGPSWKAGGNVD